MEQRDTNGYVFIGTAVRFLMDTSVGARVHTPGGIRHNIIELLGRLAEYEFHVTLRLANELGVMAREWGTELEQHVDDEEWRNTRGLTDEEAQRIRSEAGHVRETMLAEAMGKVAFIATDKRYTVTKLIGDVGSLMAPGVFDSLPDLAKHDFEEGGRAIAFDLPTAGAFHLLRATEAVLRDFYSRVVRRDRIPEPRMWAAMITNMRGKRNAPSELLLTNLDSLRSNFRNPTQHPEKTYDSDEVQDLLALSIDSVNRMCRHLESKGL